MEGSEVWKSSRELSRSYYTYVLDMVEQRYLHNMIIGVIIVVLGCIIVNKVTNSDISLIYRVFSIIPTLFGIYYFLIYYSILRFAKYCEYKWKYGVAQKVTDYCCIVDKESCYCLDIIQENDEVLVISLKGKQYCCLRRLEDG